MLPRRTCTAACTLLCVSGADKDAPPAAESTDGAFLTCADSAAVNDVNAASFDKNAEDASKC